MQLRFLLYLKGNLGKNAIFKKKISAMVRGKQFTSRIQNCRSIYSQYYTTN